MPVVLVLVGAVGIGAYVMSQSGGNTSATSPASNSAAKTNAPTANAPTTSRVDSRPPGAPPTSQTRTNSTLAATSKHRIETNVYGATVVVSTAAGKDELKRVTVPAGDTSVDVEIKHRLPVHINVELAGETVSIADVDPNGIDRSHTAEFSDNQLKAIQKAATCLIRMPDGGFGSGFLMNDRSTIVTAAHCVAADVVGDLEFAFRPFEADETAKTGAQLVFFDAGLDVAVLRLPEPMDDSWPYFIHASSPPKTSLEVHAIGNPSRGGRPDPTFLRSGKIQGVGTDEFFLDFELKPGNSGGPVCESESMVAHGIVSWKILRKVNTELSYEQLGRSFAKLTDLAGDAHSNFIAFDETGQQRHIERLEDSFVEQRAMSLAQQAALAMGFDSIMYWMLCRDVSINYIEDINRIRTRVYPTLGAARRAEREVHEKFIAEDGPKFAEKAKTEVTPRLRMSDSNAYEKAITNDSLPDDIKDRLRKCYMSYMMIKAAAENIVHKKESIKERRERERREREAAEAGEPLESDAKENDEEAQVRKALAEQGDRNVIEFFEWTTELAGKCIDNSESVLQKTGYAVE